MAWINSMMALVSSDELANDVTGAEALLERHQVCPSHIPWYYNTYVILFIVHYTRLVRQ